MSGRATLRLGVAGTGEMAQRMVAATAHVPGVHVVRVASASADRARAVASEWGVARHGSVEDLCGDSDVDAVYVANQNHRHAPTTTAALLASKGVLCEKPFAVGSAEADDVLACARDRRTLLMEAVATPFLPAVAHVVDTVASGRLGGVQRLEASFGYRVRHPRRPGAEASPGVIADRAVYPLLLALLCAGPAEAHDIRVRRDLAGLDVDAAFHLRHENGALSQLRVSTATTLDNTLSVGAAHGGLTLAAPLLLARRVEYAEQPRAERRLVRAVKDRLAPVAGDWRPYGASIYGPMLEHFAQLATAGRVQSDVVTWTLMRDVVRLADLARAA